MKSIITSILLFIISISLQSQNDIAGTITDKNNYPLEFANIVLHLSKGKTIVTGVISNQKGEYTLKNIENGTYYIEVSMLGFKTETTKPFAIENISKTVNFILKETAESLNEVVVKAKRPVIKQTAEKLILDLEHSEIVSTNLQDVMKRVPGVIVTNNGISYAGQQNVRILINGKTTEYLDVDALLRDFPADNIAKVELIEQPGAEFEASGSGPIINIILKKNVKLGTHGSVKTWAGEDEGFEYGASANLAQYINKLNWQIGSGYSSPTWREDLYIKRKVGITIYDQKTVEPYNPKTLRFNASFDYYINKTNSFGIGGRYSNTNSDRITKSENRIISFTESNALITENKFNRTRSIYNINPYYEFKSSKHQLTADFNFVNYENENANTLANTPESDVTFTSQQYNQNGAYTIKTYKLDYKRTFSNDFVLSFGSKLAQVNSDSNLQSFVENTSGGFDLDTEGSNRFIVDETIFAIYSKINYKLNQWTFSAGLRFEDSNTKGVSTNVNDTRERKISKFFPSASITRSINKHLSGALSYSYRIRRPSYSTLNSFVTFYDPLSSDVGNPNLKPAFTNSIQFNLTYDGQPFFTVAYKSTKDALFQFITQNDETAQINRSTINLSENENWSFRAFGPLSFISKKIGGFIGVIVNYNQYQSKVLTPNLELSKWNLIWFTQAEYTLPYAIKAELSGQYGTGVLEGQIEMDWFAGLDFAMSKSFMDGKFKVNAGIRKILNRAFEGRLNYNNINAEIISDQSRQNIYMQLTYKFGSKFSKVKTKRNASEDEENRINDNN